MKILTRKEQIAEAEEKFNAIAKKAKARFEAIAKPHFEAYEALVNPEWEVYKSIVDPERQALYAKLEELGELDIKIIDGKRYQLMEEDEE